MLTARTVTAFPPEKGWERRRRVRGLDEQRRRDRRQRRRRKTVAQHTQCGAGKTCVTAMHTHTHRSSIVWSRLGAGRQSGGGARACWSVDHPGRRALRSKGGCPTKEMACRSIRQG